MSVIFEVYYKSPADEARESRISKVVVAQAGRPDYRECAPEPEIGSVCLTYEFEDSEAADLAASLLWQRGEYVEGPMEYGG